MVEKFGDIEILIDNNRYYIISGWKDEVYNKREYHVPVFEREITKEEYKRMLREKKLERIVKQNFSDKQD